MKINTYVLSKSHASGKAGISRNISVNSMNISHIFRNFDPYSGKTVRILREHVRLYPKFVRQWGVYGCPRSSRWVLLVMNSKRMGW